ncbi:Protein ALP1-like, partial [Frankliniella fusca]
AVINLCIYFVNISILENSDEHGPVIWEGVQVDINDFLEMHNEAFRLHFRMCTERFEFQDLVHVIGNHNGEDCDDHVRRNDELDLRRILLLVGVVDHTLLFRDIYVGEPGSLHDSRVLRKSPWSSRLLEDETLLAPDEYILGDAAYILTNKVLVPYRNYGNLTIHQTNYNYRLSSSRSLVERAFGLLKMKWRRLHYL